MADEKRFTKSELDEAVTKSLEARRASAVGWHMKFTETSSPADRPQLEIILTGGSSSALRELAIDLQRDILIRIGAHELDAKRADAPAQPHLSTI